MLEGSGDAKQNKNKTFQSLRLGRLAGCGGAWFVVRWGNLFGLMERNGSEYDDDDFKSDVGGWI